MLNICYMMLIQNSSIFVHTYFSLCYHIFHIIKLKMIKWGPAVFVSHNADCCATTNVFLFCENVWLCDDIVWDKGGVDAVTTPSLLPSLTSTWMCE